MLEDIKTVERIGLIALMLPILPALTLLSYSMIAWFQIRHSPSYLDPDPKNMGMGIIRDYVFLFALLSPWLLILGDCVGVLFLFISGLQTHRIWRNLFMVLLANSLYFLVMLGGSVGLNLMNWIGD
jgi:hypothetical protein